MKDEKDLIAKYVMAERRRCIEILDAARFGQIDGDLRSLISRIEQGTTLKEQERKD